MTTVPVPVQHDFSTPFSSEKLPDRLRRLADLAEAAGIDAPDVYGAGEGLQVFEADVAKLLGKERGVFFATGTLAQRAALHSHQEQEYPLGSSAPTPLAGAKPPRCANTPPRVFVHPTSHLVHHECLRDGAAQTEKARAEADSRLPQFCVEFVGEFHQALRLQDFVGINLRRGDVAVVELPQRMNGGRTMAWTDLEALSAHVKKAGARLHMDGARLWEVQPFYCAGHGKSLRDIGALFDSVYVSFYKGLGGASGAMLCGAGDFICAAKTWQTKLGGSVFSSTPHWLDAKEQLRIFRDSFQARFERLQEMVRVLSDCPEICRVLRFEPPIPQSCLVHGYVLASRGAEKSSREVLDAAHERVAQRTGSRLWNNLRGCGYGRAGGGASSEQALYFEWAMGPANAKLPIQALLEGWRALAEELV